MIIGVAGPRPKYRNPKNPKETWKREGWAPAWAKPYKEAGKLETIKIKK